MTAEIVELSSRRVVEGGNEGNGALEVVRDYLARVHPARVMARSIVDQAEIDTALSDADYFLAWLWEPIE